MMTSAEPQCARAGQALGKGLLKGQRRPRSSIAIVAELRLNALARKGEPSDLRTPYRYRSGFFNRKLSSFGPMESTWVEETAVGIEIPSESRSEERRGETLGQSWGSAAPTCGIYPLCPREDQLDLSVTNC